MIFSNIYEKLRIKKLVKDGLILGRNVHIGAEVFIDVSFCWLISIGDDCTLAPRVIILAHDASTKRHLGYTKISRVNIGYKTFVGAGSVILPGVNIGNNVVIGSGSIVSRNIPDNSVAVGNPARVVKTIDTFIKENRENLKKKSKYPADGWTVGHGITKQRKREMQKELFQSDGFIE